MIRAFELIGGIMILTFMGVVLWQIAHEPPAKEQPISCTMEAKLCPDGSAVGRIGPDCSFAECPADFEEPLTANVVDFQTALQEVVRNEVGQPIEGYEPAMFMQVLPGLEPQDFDGVEAMIGHYEYSNGEIIHELGDEKEIHSAAPAMTEAGFSTLLGNIINRRGLNFEIVSVEDVITLLKQNADSGDTPTSPSPKPEIPTTPSPIPERPVACTMDAKQCPDGSYVGRVGPDCAFEKCPSPPSDSSKEISCTPESKLAEACIEIYAPVCGLVEIQCITTPCNPIPQTFSNSCFACSEKNVASYTEGACSDT